ncbi:molybdenum cofactor biosynthesis protein MoeA, partial [Archaeoglobales archaeon ex4484_92]
GKPTIVAICDNKLVIGLPGYPTSALTIFELIVAPIIRELSGIKTERRQILKAKLAVKVFSSEGRRELLPVSVVSSAKGYSVYPVTGAYSGSITSLAFSDGFIEIPEETIMVQSDQEVEVKLYSKLKPSDLIIIGSHCIGIDLILSLMRKKSKFLSKVINVGSTGGILAIKRGEADIAGTHLLDESGEYNLPIIRKYNVKNAVLVKGYLREQGLVTKKGNPKGIKSFEDLIRSDVTFINRNKGSGTRVLIDLNLRKLAEKLGQSFDELIKKICGYEIEAKTHTSVAVAVATGKADVGVAIKSVANLYGLDFIPVRSEEYDFLIARDSLDKEHVKLFIETLTSQEFAKVVEEMGGIKIYERTGEKIVV